jgi:hypothetical protein
MKLLAYIKDRRRKRAQSKADRVFLVSPEARGAANDAHRTKENARMSGGGDGGW